LEELKRPAFDGGLAAAPIDREEAQSEQAA